MAGPDSRLFGTDGIRGPVGGLLEPELALSLGRAIAEISDAPRPSVLVIRDTRESGPALEAAFASGVVAAGGSVFSGGVLPTPAAPLLAGLYSFDLAAVISASHNPWSDNGIKFFGPGGRKLDDRTEREVERVLADGGRPWQAEGWGRIERLNTAEADYLRALVGRFDLDLSGLRIALDCANGSTWKVAPEIFGRLGAEVEARAAQPDGRNINEGCGSTHMGPLSEMVRDGGFDLGFAFDGDGDRVLAVDRTGAVRDGDEIMASIALHRHSAGSLGGGVAVTVMTNFGFHRAMEAAGIDVEVTPVGDRHVSEALERRDWSFGGEQSGHLISTDFAPTGDGLAAALALIEALDGADLSEAAPMARLPQELVNVRVTDRNAFESDESVLAAIRSAEQELGREGRVLVRPSGTEPLVRVMVEAPSADQAGRICARIAEAVGSGLD